MPNQKITISEFYCTKCGERGLDIPRKAGKQREAGHLKKLWCLNCKTETNHAEVRPFGSYNLEDFKMEYELGRFVNGKKIPIKDLPECKILDCKYNVNGRCWNSNCSYKCEHRIS